jgi:hypothetical protein
VGLVSGFADTIGTIAGSVGYGFGGEQDPAPESVASVSSVGGSNAAPGDEGELEVQSAVLIMKSVA